MTSPPGPSVNESCRRRFEEHRLGGGDRSLADFLPVESDGDYAVTLEELVCIDLELRFKAWRASGGERGAEPSLVEYSEQFPKLVQGGAQDRVREELAWLRNRFGARHRLERDAQFGRYVLRERAGRGAFAEVWRAWDSALQRDVALKIPRPELASDSAVMARLSREAQSAARLHHPGIVPVYEVGSEAGLPYIVSEFVDGPTLAQAVAERAIEPDAAAALVAALADALAYAHACGVIHRDIKPGNVLMRGGESPVLTDFGLAQLAEADAALTREGEILGTPAYMPPEQARGDVAAIDERSDVYSLGVVLFELLSGRPPFEGTTSASVLYAVLHREPADLVATSGSIPADLATISLKAMAKVPGDRYASAEALGADLRRYLAHEPIRARRLGPLGQMALWVRRNPAVAGTLAVSLVAVAAVSGLAVARVLEERDRYREQRDVAQEHLNRSLVGEAEARIQGHDTGWYGLAMDALRRAAALPRRDARQLRELVFRAHSSTAPSFELVATWDARSERVRELVVSPDGRLVAAVARDNEVWLCEADDGAEIARRALGTQTVRALAFRPEGGLLAVAGDSGSVWFLDERTLDPVGEPLRVDGEIWALAFTPDGRTLAVGGSTGRISIARQTAADAPARFALDSAREIEGHADGVTCLAFSPHGDELASGGQDHAVRFWSWPTGREDRVLQEHDIPRGVRYAADGSLIYQVFETFSYSRVERGTTERLRPQSPLHAAAVRSVAFTREGLAVSGSSDGTLKCHDRQFRERAVARGGFGAVVALSAVPNSSRLIAAYADGTLRIWDLMEPPGRYWIRTDHAARFVPDSRRLVGYPTAFQFPPDAAPRATAYPPAAILALTPGPVGAVMIACADGVVERHDSDGAQTLLDVGAAVACAAISADGQMVAMGSAAGAVEVRSLTADGATPRVFRSDDGPVQQVVFLPGGGAIAALCLRGASIYNDDGSRTRLAPASGVARALAASQRWIAVGDDAGSIAVIDRRSGERARVLRVGESAVKRMAFARDGERLAVVLERGEAVLLDTQSWQRTRLGATEALAGIDVGFDPMGRFVHVDGTVLDARTGHVAVRLALRDVARIAWTRDGATLLAAGRSGAVLAWDRTTLERAADSPDHGAFVQPTSTRRSGGHRGNVWGVAASPDGRFVATAGHWGDVILWDAQTLSLERVLQSDGEIAWDVAFDADSQLVAAGTGSRVILWDAATGAEVRALDGHDEMILAVAFDPRGARLVSSARDATVRVWDTRSGASLPPLDAGGRLVYDLEFSRDGARLAGACSDGSVLLWDVAGGATEPRVLAGHTTPAWAVAFAPSGGLFASASQGGRVILRGRDLEVIALIEAETSVLRSLSFSDDASLLAGGGWLRSAPVWDLARIRKILRSMDLDWE